MAHLQQLDEQRESHRQINVSLGHVLMHALEENSHADRDQKGQRENLQRRTVHDEIPDRLGVGKNHEERGNHGEADDQQIGGETDRGNDRIEREHHVEQHDLDNG
ncbi:MAG: hypothetical protein WEB31_00260 [Chthoniobacterales bacterium]